MTKSRNLGNVVNSIFGAPGADSSTVTNIIDSDYVIARAGASTDSAAVTNLIDSDYVSARAGGSGAVSYTHLTLPTTPYV